MPKTKHHPVENHFVHITCYQIWCFTPIFLGKVPTYWHMMSLMFLTPPMEFYCNTSGSEGQGQCPCDNPVWNRSVFTETMQTKFGIICDREWLISFSQSILYVGTLIGSFVFGFFSDTYGRLSMYTLCCFWLGLTGCLVTVMPTTASFIFMRCLEGIGIGGVTVISYVYIVEYCGTSHRDTVTTLYHLPLNIGHITLAGVSYLIRHCDVYQLVLSVPLFVMVLSWWILYESPKWLMDNDRIDKAAIVMKKIAKFNGTSSCDTIETEMEEYRASEMSNAHTVIKFYEIFRHKPLRINFMCMSVIYLVCGMGYYGVSQYIGQMSGNIHLNVMISGLLLMPGTIATMFLLKLMPRRIFLMTSNLLSGLFMLSVICIPAKYKIAIMVVASIGNTFFFMSFIIIFLYSVELFPTQVRNSVVGVLSMLSRIGQIIAPPINALETSLAGAVFGVSAIIGAVLCYPLPETKNIDLPSTLEESTVLSRS